LYVPDRLAGRRVERREPAVDHADKDLAVVERHAAVHDVAAGARAADAIGLRVPAPQLLTGARVEREHVAHGVDAYSTPFATSGVASRPRSEPVS